MARLEKEIQRIEEEAFKKVLIGGYAPRMPRMRFKRLLKSKAVGYT